MREREVEVSKDASERYEASKTLASRYIKDTVHQSESWQWAIWFRYNGGQCGTRCPYWPDECFVGSDVCVECEGFEGIEIVTSNSGRVYCRNKKAEVKPMPECYFLPEGRIRQEQKKEPYLPVEPCPW